MVALRITGLAYFQSLSPPDWQVCQGGEAMPAAPEPFGFGYQPPETCAAMWNARRTAGTLMSLRI
jgi:hypothetical protein